MLMCFLHFVNIASFYILQPFIELFIISVRMPPMHKVLINEEI
jgi:hypothetical protein